MSAEEAAEQKAKNIVNAFKTELDKLSLDTTTADLEYQLWEKLNPNATSAEKAAMNMSLLANKLELQASAFSWRRASIRIRWKRLEPPARKRRRLTTS